MKIKKATVDQYQDIRLFYHHIIDESRKRLWAENGSVRCRYSPTAPVQGN